MTVIERIECPEHGARNVIGRRCGAWERPYVFCTRELVTVEYVPATRLEAAMRLLDEAVASSWMSPDEGFIRVLDVNAMLTPVWAALRGESVPTEYPRPG